MPSKSKFRALRRATVTAVAFAGGLWVCSWMIALSNADSAATAPATREASTRPAFAPEVQRVVDRLAATYAQTPARLAGEVVSDFDVAGIKRGETIAFTSERGMGQQFRHEASGELIVVSDATTLHLYDVKRNTFANNPLADNAEGANEILASIDPVLLIAVSGDAGAAVSLDDAAVTLATPIDEAGRSFDRLQSSRDGAVRTIWIDRERGTIDRIETDFVGLLKARGAADVKRALVTQRYTKSALGGEPIDVSRFAYAPPADATPMRIPGATRSQGDATALVGKPAPAFELIDIDGNAKRLADTKGKVVVLDFWATWCPPCREGLPHIADAAKSYADRGVVVWAINQGEAADVVKAFLTKESLDVTTLLDEASAVGAAYGASAIPETVVIGRDGKVTKVFVGLPPGGPSELTAAIDAALK